MAYNTGHETTTLSDENQKVISDKKDYNYQKV